MDTHCLVARGPPDGAAIETGIFLGTLQCLSRSSKLFRSHLSLSNRVSQSLEDEWQLAQKYLAIEQARLEDRLRVEVDLCPSCLNYAVPCLALLGLIENAIKHGVAPDARRGRSRGGSGHPPINGTFPTAQTANDYRRAPSGKR